MKPNNIKVTTTSGFEGVTIIEYLEPITANIIIPKHTANERLRMPIAETTEFRNGMRSIDDEVIQELRMQAYAIGANCILGLNICTSISDKEMMVTAIGTAAKAIFSRSELHECKTQRQLITGESLNIHRKRIRYLNDANNGTLKVDEEFWAFITANRIHELIDYLIEKYMEVSRQRDYSSAFGKFDSNLRAYISRLDYDTSINALYKWLHRETKSYRKKIIAKLIIGLNFLDYNETIPLITSSNLSLQKIALQILEIEKKHYHKSDIEKINSLIAVISCHYKEMGTIKPVTELISAKLEDTSNCECGSSKYPNEAYCDICSYHFTQFDEYKIDPGQILEKLKCESIALEELFH